MKYNSVDYCVSRKFMNEYQNSVKENTTEDKQKQKLVNTMTVHRSERQNPSVGNQCSGLCTGISPGQYCNSDDEESLKKV